MLPTYQYARGTVKYESQSNIEQEKQRERGLHHFCVSESININIHIKTGLNFHYSNFRRIYKRCPVYIYTREAFYAYNLILSCNWMQHRTR